MADPIDFGAVAGLLLGGLSLFLYGMEKMSNGAPQLPAHMRTRALSTFTRRYVLVLRQLAFAPRVLLGDRLGRRPLPREPLPLVGAALHSPGS